MSCERNIKILEMLTRISYRVKLLLVRRLSNVNCDHDLRHHEYYMYWWKFYHVEGCTLI